MITDLVNQIIVEGVTPAEWEFGVFLNCYKRKGDALERGNYGGLKLRDQILKRAEIVIQKLIRQLLDAVRVYAKMCNCKPNTIFILRQFKGKDLTKKKNLYFAFVDCEKAFDLVPRDVV